MKIHPWGQPPHFDCKAEDERAFVWMAEDWGIGTQTPPHPRIVQRPRQNVPGEQQLLRKGIRIGQFRFPLLMTSRGNAGAVATRCGAQLDNNLQVAFRKGKRGKFEMVQNWQ